MVPCRRGIIVDAIAIGGFAGYFLAELGSILAGSGRPQRLRTSNLRS
jgi:hypothetical protein